MKKRIISVVTILMLLLSATVNAAQITNVQLKDFENSIYTVTGTADTTVSIVAVPGGTLSEGNYSATSTSGVTIQTATPGANNAFAVDFKFPAPSDTYSFYVSGNSTPFTHEVVSRDTILDFVEDLSGQEIAENAIYALLETYASNMAIDISFVTNDDAKDAVAKNLYEYHSQIADRNDLAAVQNIVKLTKYELDFLTALSGTQTPTTVNSALINYDTVKSCNTCEAGTACAACEVCSPGGVPGTCVETDVLDISAYLALGSDYKKGVVCDYFMGETYTSIRTFKNDLAVQVAAAALLEEPAGDTPTYYPVPNNPNNPGFDNGSNGSVGGGSAPITVNPNKPVVQPGGNEASGVRLFEMYNDVNNVSWAWDAILYLSDKNIMNGVGNNQFLPEETVKREQFAKIITLGFNAFESGKSASYSDLVNDGWSADYIAAAQAAGLMTGVSDSSFGYGQDISRQDICVAIYRAAKLAGYKFGGQKTDFSDFNDVADYAKEAVAYLAGAGIISGNDDGSFAPERNATRAEAAKIVYGVLGGIK